MDVNLYVREMGTQKIVQTIAVHDASERKLERVEMGLLRHMDLGNFYVDTAEADAAIAAQPPDQEK